MRGEVSSIAPTAVFALRVRELGIMPSDFRHGVFVGYYAYFGTYEVDEKQGVVRHYVQASLWPEEVGRLYTRSIELSDDRLRLTTPPFLWAGESAPTV